MSIHQHFIAENKLWEAKTSFLCTNVPTFQSQVHLEQHKLTLTMVRIIQFCLSDLHLSEKSKCLPTLICLRVAWDHCTTSNLVDGVECYSIYTWIYFMPIWFKLTLATDEPDDNERGIGPWRVHPSVAWSAPNDLPSYHTVSWEDSATLPAPMMVASVVNVALWLCVYAGRIWISYQQWRKINWASDILSDSFSVKLSLPAIGVLSL